MECLTIHLRRQQLFMYANLQKLSTDPRAPEVDKHVCYNYNHTSNNLVRLFSPNNKQEFEWLLNMLPEMVFYGLNNITACNAIIFRQ